MTGRCFVFRPVLIRLRGRVGHDLEFGRRVVRTGSSGVDRLQCKRIGSTDSSTTRRRKLRLRRH